MKSRNRFSRQLNFDHLLFPSNEVDSVKGKVIYNGIPVEQATFMAGLSTRVHRWFRLTPSFGPYLVREMLSTLNCGSKDAVLDAFAGVGTTLIECQLEGLTSYGFEINPFLKFVSDTCLNWELNPSVLRTTLNKICEEFTKLDSQINYDNLAAYGLKVPKIHNPTKWWRPDVLKQLLVLKSCINSLMCTETIKAFFKLSLAGVLVPDLTNVTLARLQLHFIDRTSDDIQVLQTFASHARDMIGDIDEIHRLGLHRTSKVFLVDSTNTKGLKIDKPIRCVITSPPYPNRYSYVWNTRPHLYFFDFFSTAKQAAELDKITIGGTWGSATSILAKGKIAAEYPIIEEIVSPVVETIRQSDNLMANYAMKYFNLLAKQIVEMDRFLTRDARIAYVVGCSRLKGVYIEADVMLGEILEGLELGYKVSAIERIRRRHSGKNLHESIVYAWKK
jgi:tRNA G10  N-methylase Trm11